MLMAVAMASFLFVGCIPGVTPDPDPDPDVAVASVTLDQETLALVAGGATGTLVETVLPVDATNQSVTWASSDKTVAIVSLGVVTSLNAGIVAITVTTVDGGFDAICVVTVTAAEPPAGKSDAPVITSVPRADDGYVNGEVGGDNGTITTVTGYGVDGSIVKLYLDGKLIGTTVASKAKSSYAIFAFEGLDVDLGEDGVKTLYATAKEYGLAVSDLSDPYTFMLDTTPPELETASIDGIVFEDGDFVLFLGPDSFEEITAEMSESVSLVLPNAEPVITLSGTIGGEPFTGDWATFEISEDGLTLTLAPATVWLAIGGPTHTVPEFYVYREGEFVISYAEGLVKDAAGNENVEGTFTLTYRDVGLL